MYRWTRVSDVHPGKFADGLGWAMQVTKYANEKFPDMKVGCYLETFGAAQRVHWSCEFASLDDFARKTEQLLADKEYMKLLAQGGPLFVAGSGHDTLVKKLG